MLHITTHANVCRDAGHYSGLPDDTVPSFARTGGCRVPRGVPDFCAPLAVHWRPCELCVCVCVCMYTYYVCMNAYIQTPLVGHWRRFELCVCLCMCVYVCVCVYRYMRHWLFIGGLVSCAYAYICKYMCVYIYTHTYIHAHAPLYKH